MTRHVLVRCLAVVAPLMGCGDFTDRDQDGGVAAASDCWPIESATPGGSIELGLDSAGFAPLPDELTFIEGTQTRGGVLLLLHARMVGLEPGNLDDLLDPGNPRTHFSATFADGTSFARECPSTMAYRPAGEDGVMERRSGVQFELEPMEVAKRGFNTVVRLKVEIIDADGRYASDERDVFCAEPEGWSDDAGPADGGLADAGPEADGGAADAAAGDIDELAP